MQAIAQTDRQTDTQNHGHSEIYERQLDGVALLVTDHPSSNKNPCQNLIFFQNPTLHLYDFFTRHVIAK